jgi:hypothetical protein
MKTPELARIADIVSPSLPAPEETNTLFYLVIAILGITIFIIHRYRQSAISQLRQLRQQHRQGVTDNRVLAFRISKLICRQLQLSRISPHHVPLHLPHPEWNHFASRLQSACFSRQGPDNDLLNHLLDEASLWVKK